MNLLQDGDIRPLPNVLWNLLLAIIPVLASFALAPQARAVCQEGCLTNNNRYWVRMRS